MPKRPPVRSSSCMSFTVRIAPVAPRGCPRAIAPPFGFTFAGSSESSLLQAQETLAKKKYGVNEIARLVVTSKISRKEKREGTIRGTTTGASITSYHYVWDEYHVVTAEKVGDEVWVYHNLLKYYHSSDTVTPQDEWILSQRFPSTQILPENLSK